MNPIRIIKALTQGEFDLEQTGVYEHLSIEGLKSYFGSVGITKGAKTIEYRAHYLYVYTDYIPDTFDGDPDVILDGDTEFQIALWKVDAEY